MRKPTFEQAIDLAHLASRGNFTVHCAQRRQHILTQVPERFEIASEAHSLRDTLHGMATMDLQERQHGCPNPAHLAIRGAARAKAWKRQ